MKRNTLLLSVVVGLVTFVYFYHEVGDKKRREQQQKQRQVFDPAKLGDLQSFSTIKTTIYTNGQHYFYRDSDQREINVDERKVDALFSALSHLHLKREFGAEEVEQLGLKLFFTTTGSEVEKLSFQFDQAKLTFILGKKLDFDQSFYMKVIEDFPDGESVERYIIAYDQASLEVPVARTDYHRTDVKYRRFQSLLYLDHNYFRDYRLFAEWMDAPWTVTKIDIDNKRNRRFTVSLVDRQTDPPPPRFLKLSLSQLKQFEKDLVTLEAKDIVKTFPKQVTLLSTATVWSSRGQISYELYSARQNGEQKMWLKSLEQNTYYEMPPETAQLFLGSVQRFWDLQLLSSMPQQVQLTAKGQTIVSRDARLSKLLTKKARFVVDAGYLIDAKKLFDLNWAGEDYSLLVNKDEYMLLHQQTKVGLIYGKEGTGLVDYYKELFE